MSILQEPDPAVCAEAVAPNNENVGVSGTVNTMYNKLVSEHKMFYIKEGDFDKSYFGKHDWTPFILKAPSSIKQCVCSACVIKLDDAVKADTAVMQPILSAKSWALCDDYTSWNLKNGIKLDEIPISPISPKYIEENAKKLVELFDDCGLIMCDYCNQKCGVHAHYFDSLPSDEDYANSKYKILCDKHASLYQMTKKVKFVSLLSGEGMQALLLAQYINPAHANSDYLSSSHQELKDGTSACTVHKIGLGLGE